MTSRAIREEILTIDGYFLDDAGNMVMLNYVDLRAASEREPVTTLVKGCHKEHAIERSRQLMVSKPARFREHGEGLVMDPAEASASRIDRVSKTVTDPSELQAFIDEAARSEGMPTGLLEVTERTTRVSHTKTDAYTFGQNGWMFSTSLAPRDEDEHRRWRNSLPSGYNHVSRIYRSREFARALGSMVVDQVGPQGQDCEATHSFEGREPLKTNHSQQVIVHGPVAYVEDPYEVFNGDRPMGALAYHSVFLKGLEYRDQREYRFVIWSEKEPAKETMHLVVSMAMLGAMQKPPTTARQRRPR